MTQHIAQRPRDIATCANAYLQAGDLDGITTLFHPDCQIFFPPDQPPLRGRDGARAAFEGLIDLKPTLHSEPQFEVINGDTALIGAKWQISAPDGTVLAEGQSTEVVKQMENGGWVYLIDSPNGPPPLQHA